MGGTEESLFTICNKVFILVLALTVSVTYKKTGETLIYTNICYIGLEFFESSRVRVESRSNSNSTRTRLEGRNSGRFEFEFRVEKS